MPSHCSKIADLFKYAECDYEHTYRSSVGLKVCAELAILFLWQ